VADPTAFLGDSPGQDAMMEMKVTGFRTWRTVSEKTMDLIDAEANRAEHNDQYDGYTATADTRVGSSDLNRNRSSKHHGSPPRVPPLCT
jgi:hypothetical protein